MPVPLANRVPSLALPATVIGTEETAITFTEITASREMTKTVTAQTRQEDLVET